MDISKFGKIQPETANRVLDEELTDAAERLANFIDNGHALVPRRFQQRGEHLIDEHGQDLKKVIESGVEYAQQMVADKVPGADWELRRRRHEQETYRRIVFMPAATACIEISGTPIHHPEDERRIQGYDSLTHCRVTHKLPDGQVCQYNFITSSNNQDFLSQLQLGFGTAAEDVTDDTDELLGRPYFINWDGDPQALPSYIQRQTDMAKLNSIDDHGVSMAIGGIRRAKETWNFVCSQRELHNDFMYDLMLLAITDQVKWDQGIQMLRAGFWKQMLEIHKGLHIISSNYEAAQRAAEAGDIFIGCGGMVDTRTFKASSLLKESGTVGGCQSCGLPGKLYGCGVFCQSCNSLWVEEYDKNGRQLDSRDLAYRAKFRGRYNKVNGSKNETMLQWVTRKTAESKAKL